jgi:hypothetical protein
MNYGIEELGKYIVVLKFRTISLNPNKKKNKRKIKIKRIVL